MQRRVLLALRSSLALVFASSVWPQPSAQAAEGDDAVIALARDLELVITETGPEQPWTLHLRNRGSTPVGVMADPGLLWFEVAVPGVPTPRICRLPEPLWPTTMRRRAALVLPAGERFSRRFDPRFFCFTDIVQTTLVPGAKVTPHFGWPHTEARGGAGKGKAAPPSGLNGPFVAWAGAAPAEAAAPPAEGVGEINDEGAEGGEPPQAAAPWLPPTEGLQTLSGGTLVLTAPYAKWSERTPAPVAGINVAMLAGSDAEDERGAVITVGVGNGAAVPQTVVLRRELFSFDVVGPDGPFACPTGDLGSPDFAAFTTLAPRASEQFVVRLLEMCPRGSFSRPGVYEVRATFHATSSGQALGIDAFVGDVASPRPALVRVRSGERPSFLRAAPMVAGTEGPAAAPAAVAPAPAEGDVIEGPEQPSEEQPAEPSPALDNGPAQELPAPPDGTSVE